MATVKYTYSVSQAVTNKVRSAYTARIEAKNKELEAALNAEALLTAFIEGSGGMELYEASKHWLNTSNSIRVGRINGVALGGIYYYFEGAPRHVPYHPHELEGPQYDEMAANYKRVKDEIAVLVNQRTDAERSVGNAFRSYGSVNTAIKEHPELANMLPAYVIEKINQKVTKTKASDIEVEVDAGLVNQIAVLAKFAESS